MRTSSFICYSDYLLMHDAMAGFTQAFWTGSKMADTGHVYNSNGSVSRMKLMNNHWSHIKESVYTEINGTKLRQT